MTGDVAMDTVDVMDSDDADWYREEVGEEPDPGKWWRLTCYNTLPCSPRMKRFLIFKGIFLAEWHG